MAESTDFIKGWLATQTFTNDRIRCDCPLCGGTNTFTATKSAGGYYYICFRASCSISGRVRGYTEASWIKEYLNKKSSPESKFVLPAHFRSVDGNLKCADYIVRNNIDEAYADGRVQLRYDAQQDRIVFLIYKDGECNGATGRGLDSRITPKWYRYDSGTVSSFLCHTRAGTSGFGGCILVEDCASACSASRVLDSVAILGTHLLDAAIAELAKYETVYIALDRDASRKSLNFHRYLSLFITDPHVIFLDKDLKHCATDEIQGLIDGTDGAMAH